MAERKNEARWIENRNRWQINVQKDGMRRTFCSSTPGKKGKVEAERKADRWLELEDMDDTVRLGVLWDSFLEYTLEVTSKVNQKCHEKIGRIWILPKLKHKRVSKITTVDWQNCITAAYAAGRSKKTCQNIRGTIVALYRYSKKMSILMNPVDDLIIPKDAPVGTRTILQEHDLKTLFSVDTITIFGKQSPAWYINLWRLVVLTGLRRGEACGLKKEDYSDCKLNIRRSINSDNEITSGKTINAQRSFVLSELAEQVLKDQKKMLLKNGIISDWIFPDKLGQQPIPNLVYKEWYKYRQEHGIRSSLHEMRHTHISWLKSAVSEELLKQEVGHGANMKTYDIYGHEVNGELKLVANAVDDVFSKAIKK